MKTDGYYKSIKDINEKLEQQQFEIIQSLKYASYIQQSLFPSVKDLAKVFTKHFVFFKPRDIVSGDFYWIHKAGDQIIVAVADCTGHGVPGAFMSIMGISFLNQVISKHKPSTAASALNILREYVMKSLNQFGGENEQKDGLDMALCIIDKQRHELQFSGAFNPLYVFRNSELIQLDADKMPIGVAAEVERSFTNRQMDLKKDDMIYMFTDGFPDQFGGPFGKKFKYKHFREMLQSISHQSCKEQQDQLQIAFNEWKGDQPQLDDVTILGIRY